jgi:lysophospholipase L1-like esterase
MIETTKRWLLAMTAAAALATGATAFAQDKPATETPKPTAKAPAPKESAVEPKPRPGNWMQRHETYVKDAKEKAGKVDVLFVGDSITDGWHGAGGKALFAENFEPMKAHNIGIGGDRTQHVIWRLQNGEVAGLAPKVTMLMIGTNNLGGNTNEEIVDGITACVKEIQKQMPSTKILLLGVFPRGEKADNPARARIKAINEKIAKLDDGGKTVRYLDIGDKFLEPDGTLPKSIMPDALHPNKKGYEIWTEAVKGPITEMLK